MLSIITPTYNRADKLKRVYESLVKQTNNDFEWIVIDDGSSDETKIVVEKLIKTKKIKIKYIYKDNGGKPSAYNIGVKKVTSEILVCLDSDDGLVSNAVDTILNDYEQIKDDDTIAGMAYNCATFDGEVIGNELPDGVVDTYYNIYKKYHVVGDKTQVIKTKVAREYPFPEIVGEKFIPEALINNRISKKYNFLYRNFTAKNVEYLADGYSSNYFELVKKNPKGNALYFKELYSFEKTFYNVYGYILFCIYGRIGFREILKGHPAKIKIVFMYLPTYIISKLK